MVGQNNRNQQQDESVYNLIPRTEIRPVKPPRYESKFREDVRQSFKEGKHEHRTMGYAEEPVPHPKDFLKKHTNDVKPTVGATSRDPSKGRDQTNRKPAVPNIRDAPKMGARTEKNFIQTNALDAVMMVPKRAERNLVDDRFGDKFSIDPSGLTPKYVLKKNFGEVPVYIKQRRADMDKAKEEYQAYVTDYFRRGAMREMNDSERQTLIEGLKKQWEDVHHEFQTLSVMIDTVPKKLHKERLEHQMQLLEKDIDLLQKHQTIYIAD